MAWVGIIRCDTRYGYYPLRRITYVSKSFINFLAWFSRNSNASLNTLSASVSYSQLGHQPRDHSDHGSCQHPPFSSSPVLERALVRNISRGSHKGEDRQWTGPCCHRHPSRHRWTYLQPSHCGNDAEGEPWGPPTRCSLPKFVTEGKQW